MGVFLDARHVEDWMKTIMGQGTDFSHNVKVTPEDVNRIVEAITESCSAKKGTKDLPITLAMTKVQVFIDGVDDRLKASLSCMVREMNGVVCSNFSQITTHLVTTNPLSTNTILARQLGIPIMHPDWIEKSYTESTYDPYKHCKAFQNQFQQPLFSNLYYSLSKEVGEFSKYVKDALNVLGGKEVEVNQLKQSDLLVCRHSYEPEYLKASRVGAHCCTPAWPVVCHFENFLHDIRIYAPKSPEIEYLIYLDNIQEDIRRKVDPESLPLSNLGPIGSIQQNNPPQQHPPQQHVSPNKGTASRSNISPIRGQNINTTFNINSPGPRRVPNSIFGGWRNNNFWNNNFATRINNSPQGFNNSNNNFLRGGASQNNYNRNISHPPRLRGRQLADENPTGY